MKMIAIPVASSMLLLGSFSAISAEWVPLGTDSHGSAWHVNMDSIARDKDLLTAWKRIEFKPPRPHFLHGTPIKRAFVLGATDCAQRRASVKAIGLVDTDDSVVAVHEYRDNGSTHWPPGTHASLLDTAINMVCSRGEREALKPTKEAR